MHVHIIGPIGVGKSTFIRKLASYFPGDIVILDDMGDGNQFVNEFYSRCGEISAFTSQASCMLRYAEQGDEIREMLLDDPDRIIFEDRSLDDAYYVFSRLLYELGFMSTDELELLHVLYPRCLPNIPDVVVHLDAPTDVILSRIKQRNREYEQDTIINELYMTRMREMYYEYYEILNEYESPVITVCSREYLSGNEIGDIARLVTNLGMPRGMLSTKGPRKNVYTYKMDY